MDNAHFKLALRPQKDHYYPLDTHLLGKEIVKDLEFAKNGCFQPKWTAFWSFSGMDFWCCEVTDKTRLCALPSPSTERKPIWTDGGQMLSVPLPFSIGCMKRTGISNVAHISRQKKKKKVMWQGINFTFGLNDFETESDCVFFPPSWILWLNVIISFEVLFLCIFPKMLTFGDFYGLVRPPKKGDSKSAFAQPKSTSVQPRETLECFCKNVIPLKCSFPLLCETPYLCWQ